MGIGAAVIGTGFMGGTHVEALRRAGVDVVAVLGSTADSSAKAARRWDIPHAAASLDDLLSRQDVQSIHICTPNRTHFEMASRSLQSGRHVLCEKPLAMSSDESRQLVEMAARRPNQAAGINYNIRFYPLCLEARHRARSGELGDLFHVTGSYVQDWLLKDTDYNWRLLDSEGGALRAVADIGGHWLDLAESVTGRRVESLCADLHTVHPQRRRPLGEVQTFASQQAEQTEPVEIRTDDAASILLRLEGGVSGCLHVSQVTAGRKNCLRLEIAGSLHSLAWNSEQPNELWIGHRDRPNELLLRDPALLSPPAQAAADYPGGHNQGYADTFKQCFLAFYRYIEAGDFGAPPPFPTFADGHRQIELGECVLRSTRQRQWVECPA